MVSKKRFKAKRLIDNFIGKINSIKKVAIKDLPKNPKIIIILKLSAIGDSLLSLPAIKKLKEKTNAKIIVVHSSDNSSVFMGHDFIDKRFLLDVAGSNLINLIKTLKKIKKEDAELVYDLSHTGNLSSNWANYLGRYSVGFYNPQYPKRKNNYNKEIKLNFTKHMVLNYFDAFLDYIEKEEERNLLLVKPKYEKKDLIFVSKKLRGKKNLIAIHPCHEIVEKSRPKEDYIKIIEYVISAGFTPVLLGSPKESKNVSELLKGISDEDSVLDFSGKLNISQVFSLLKKTKVFIGNDGGLMHSASAMKIPTIGFFMGGSSISYYPLGEENIAIKSKEKEAEYFPKIKKILEKIDKD